MENMKNMNNIEHILPFCTCLKQCKYENNKIAKER